MVEMASYDYLCLAELKMLERRGVSPWDELWSHITVKDQNE